MSAIAEKAASKYRNVKVENQYGSFDSIKESERYPELLILERCGKISNLRKQFKIRLLNPFYLDGKWEPGIKYYADFAYEKDGRTVIEDVKSEATKKKESYRIKRQLLLAKYPEIIFLET